MKKIEAKMYLKEFKELKNYDVINIDSIETLENDSLYIVFSASKGRNGYYGVLENGVIVLELAGRFGGSTIMNEYELTLQGGAIYITPAHNKGRKIVISENVTDLIAYEVKIESTIKDLHDNYKIDEADVYYKLIIQTIERYNDIELIYNNIDNIKHDYDFIKQYLKAL